MANACVIYAGQVLDCNGFNETDNSNAAQLVYKNISNSDWEEIFLDDTQTDGLRQNAKNPTDADAYVYDKNGNLVIFESPCPKKLICTYESMTDKLLGNTEGIWSMELDCRNENNQPSSASSATAMVTVLSDIGNGYKAGDTAETTYVSASGICKYDFSGETLPSETGYDRFKGCTALTRCDLLCSMSEISQATFSGCTNLSSYTNTNFVSEIRPSAFADCTSLENIVIGPHVKSIGKSAFTNCSSAKNLIFKYGTKSNVTPYTGQTYCDSISGIPDYTFANCISLSGTSFPSNGTAPAVDGIIIPNSVSGLGIGSFSGCTSIKHLYGEEVTYIGSYAFNNCTSLQTVELSSVTVVGEGCFKGCYNLTSIELPSIIYNIGDNAFSGCSRLTTISLGNGDAAPSGYQFGFLAFYNTAISSVTLDYDDSETVFVGLNNSFDPNRNITFYVNNPNIWNNAYSIYGNWSFSRRT